MMPDLRELLQALTPNVPLPRTTEAGIHTSTHANGIDAAGNVLVYQPPDVIEHVGSGGSNYLPITGGQMQGPLLLQADPVAALGAVTKQYADSMVGGPFLPLSGGQLTGALLLAANPVAATGAATKAYVDSRPAGLTQVSHNLSMLGLGTAASPLSVNPATNAQIAQGTDTLPVITPAGLRSQLGADAATLPTTQKTLVPAIAELWGVTERLGQSSIFSGPLPPRNPVDGMLWYRTDPDGDLYTYFNDGQTTQWVTTSKPAGTVAAVNNLSDQVEEHIPIMFPPNPNFGDEYTALSGGTYRWDGIVWQGLMAPLDAPSDGQYYARRNAQWETTVGQPGGVFTGPVDIQNQIGFSRLTLTVANVASRASLQFRQGGIALWDFHMPGFGPNVGHLVFGRHSPATGLPLDNPLVITNLPGGVVGDTRFEFSGDVLIDRQPTQPAQVATKQYVDLLASGAQRLIGAFDAATGQVVFDPATGLPPGELPPAAPANNNDYVIVHNPGTPSVGPPETLVPLVVGDWIISVGVAWLVLHVGGAVAVGRTVSLLPPVFGQDNVQDGMEVAEIRADAADASVVLLEARANATDANLTALDTRKLNLAGGTMTGSINFNNQTGTNLRDPTGAQDAVNKRYADARANNSTATGWVNAEQYQNGFSGNVQSCVVTIAGNSLIYLRGSYGRVPIPTTNTGAFFLAAGHRPSGFRGAIGMTGPSGSAPGYAVFEINTNGHIYIRGSSGSSTNGYVDGIVIPL